MPHYSSHSWTKHERVSFREESCIVRRMEQIGFHKGFASLAFTDSRTMYLVGRSKQVLSSNNANKDKSPIHHAKKGASNPLV